MHKISQTRSRAQGRVTGKFKPETAPERIPGATVTAAPTRDLDLPFSLFQRVDWTVEGACAIVAPSMDKVGSRRKETLALWDGTEITFNAIE